MTMSITQQDAILLIGGIFTFPATFILQIYLLKNWKVLRKITKKSNLTDKDIADIANKIISAFQAVLCALSGFIVCINCYHDVMYATHPVTLIYAYFGIPYFIYDTFSMYYVETIGCNSTEFILVKFIRFVMSQPVIVIHHIILAPLGFSLIAFYRDGIHNGDFFVGIVYMMEASTPFVSFRFILSKLKMKSSFLYALNGVIMLVSFPIFRIISLFYAVEIYSRQYQVGYFKSLWILPLGWKLTFIAAVAPQIYWFFLMWRGFFKMLMETRSKKEGYQPNVVHIEQEENNHFIPVSNSTKKDS